MPVTPIKGGRTSSTATAIFESLKDAVGSAYARGFTRGQSIDPSAYVSADAFALDYAVCKFLSKYKGDTAADLKKKAITAFKEAESKNRRANDRIRSGALSSAAIFCLDEARRKIQSCLRNVNLQEIFDCCEWGPGATATILAEDATVDQKILEPRFSVSRLALPYAKLYLSNSRAWLSARWRVDDVGLCCLLDSEFSIHDSGRFTTVPKDWKSERGIDVQPTLNIFLQKGVGQVIRRRLKRVGVDLDDQSRNQILASLAQRAGLATIDLAQASDSLCFELVRYLLPPDWFRILRDFRAPSVEIEGSVVHLEKFSAMGNGYTFELESLIFWSLCEALRERFSLTDTPLGIYGDDIIIDARLSGALIALFKEVGFSVNVDKTFTEGRFYESCGKHYFDGVDVTPPYQKEVISDLPSAIRSANRLFRWALRMGGGTILDERIHRPWSVAFAAVTAHLDAINASRWIRWVERGSGTEPKPLPLPAIPWWLGDDFGVLYPGRFQTRNGVISFDRLHLVPRSRPGDEWALLSNYLRRGAKADRATYGLVNPRGGTKFLFGRGKTLQIEHPSWPESWPLNPT